MIGSLRGQVLSILGPLVTIDVGGVGYEVTCTGTALTSLATSHEEGSAAQVITYTEMREDSLRLFGFANRLEREVFLLLLKVRGIGTKIALEVISSVQVRELLRIIGSGDLKKLQSIRGIGKKTAERIVVELKDKVSEYAIAFVGDSENKSTDVIGEAIEAMIALGFSRKEATTAVDQAHAESGTSREVGVLVSAALRHI